MALNGNDYGCLGLVGYERKEVVRKKYLTLAKIYDPELGETPNKEKFLNISRAYKSIQSSRIPDLPSTTNHYLMFGLNASASQQEINKAYHLLCKRHHPDAYPHATETEKIQLDAQMKLINDFKDKVLADAVKVTRNNLNANFSSPKNDRTSKPTTPPNYSTKTKFDSKNFKYQKLQGRNFCGKNLSGAFFSGADLTEANLSRADFTASTLIGANLGGANLSNANFSGADLTGANLSRADLSNASFSGADLTGANLSRADLSNANFSEADLSRADLTRADLTDANLNRARFNFAKLSDVKFNGELKGLNFDYSQFSNLRKVNFVNCSFKNAFFKGNVKQIHYEDCEMNNASFSHANLELVKFIQFPFTNIREQKTLIDFSNSKMTSCKFFNWRMDFNFKQAHLKSVKFRNIKFNISPSHCDYKTMLENAIFDLCIFEKFPLGTINFIGKFTVLDHPLHPLLDFIKVSLAEGNSCNRHVLSQYDWAKIAVKFQRLEYYDCAKHAGQKQLMDYCLADLFHYCASNSTRPEHIEKAIARWLPDIKDLSQLARMHFLLDNVHPVTRNLKKEKGFMSFFHETGRITAWANVMKQVKEAIISNHQHHLNVADKEKIDEILAKKVKRKFMM